MQINQAMQHEHNALRCWTSDTLAPTCSRPSCIRDLVVVPPLKAIARATTTTRTITKVPIVEAVTGTMRAIVVTIETAIVPAIVVKVTTSTVTIVVALAKRLNYSTQLKLQVQCFTTCKQVTVTIRTTAIVRPVRARTRTRIRTAIGAGTASSKYKCKPLSIAELCEK